MVPELSSGVYWECGGAWMDIHEQPTKGIPFMTLIYFFETFLYLICIVNFLLAPLVGLLFPPSPY